MPIVVAAVASANLRIRLPIAVFWAAAFGFAVALDGEGDAEVEIEPGTQPGEVRVLRGEVGHLGRRRPPAHRPEGSARVVRKAPVTDLARRCAERVAKRTLLIIARAQRQRLVQRVAETRVDVPGAVGVLVRGQSRHREHQVVRHRVGGRPVGPVNPADVAGHVVAEGAQ